jgi:hypothetical protein
MGAAAAEAAAAAESLWSAERGLLVCVVWWVSRQPITRHMHKAHSYSMEWSSMHDLHLCFDQTAACADAHMLRSRVATAIAV